MADRRMVEFVAAWQAAHPPADAVDLTDPPPPTAGVVDLVRGELYQRRVFPDGGWHLIGHVDRADRNGHRIPTWRGLAATGETLTSGHRTRRAAVAALLTALHINPEEYEP